MVNQDDVFVITEDDILKPPEKAKGRGAGARGGPMAVPKSGARPDRSEDEGPPAAPARSGSGSRGPNPAAAGTLSLWAWGLGQLYNGDRRLASLFALCEVLVLALHYMLYQVWEPLRQFAHLFFISEWEMMLYVSAFDFCLLFFAIYNVSQAYRAAEERGGRFTGLHQPLLSGVASMLIPGWGQMLNGQLRKGILFLFFFLVQAYLIVLYMLSPFYRLVMELDPREILLKKAIWVGMGVLFFTALSWLIGAYDAWIVARYTRRRS